MQNRGKPPIDFTGFKGKPPRVSVSKPPEDDADLIATKALVEQYSREDTFYCPRCPFTTTDPDQAVYHLAEEINKTLDRLGRKPEQ